MLSNAENGAFLVALHKPGFRPILRIGFCQVKRFWPLKLCEADKKRHFSRLFFGWTARKNIKPGHSWKCFFPSAETAGGRRAGRSAGGSGWRTTGRAASWGSRRRTTGGRSAGGADGGTTGRAASWGSRRRTTGGRSAGGADGGRRAGRSAGGAGGGRRAGRPAGEQAERMRRVRASPLTG